jgi:hypothetical protein
MWMLENYVWVCIVVLLWYDVGVYIKDAWIC